MLFELSNIRSDDARTQARAEGYLLQNPNPGVRIRPQQQLAMALETGFGLLVELEGEICGLSLIFKFDISTSGPIYPEMGSMLVTANDRGLQVFLAKLHLLQLRLEEFSEVDFPPVFAVVTPGSASAHNLGDHAHMEVWSPPKELVAVRSASGVPFLPEKTALIARERAYISALEDLRQWHEDGSTFRCPKGDDKVAVRLGWFDPSLLK
jgi:hypothetical protein